MSVVRSVKFVSSFPSFLCPCYHFRYSFVPCKYISSGHHASVSLIHCVSTQDSFGTGKTAAQPRNSHAVFCFSRMPSYEKRLYWGGGKRKRSTGTRHSNDHKQAHQAHVINNRPKCGKCCETSTFSLLANPSLTPSKAKWQLQRVKTVLHLPPLLMMKALSFLLLLVVYNAVWRNEMKWNHW